MPVASSPGAERLIYAAFALGALAWLTVTLVTGRATVRFRGMSTPMTADRRRIDQSFNYWAFVVVMAGLVAGLAWRAIS